MKKSVFTGLVGLLVVQPAMATDLIDAYEKALAYDSGIASARATYEAQQANVDVTRSQLLPKIDAYGNAQHIDTDGPRTDDSYKSYGYGVELTQPLFRAENWFNYDASQFQSESARADYSLAQQQLILDVATAYFNVLRAEDNLTTVRAAEAAFERQYDQAQERFDVGLIAITEVYESRASYDASKSERISAESDLDIAREQLSRLIGENAGDLENLQQEFPLSRPQPTDPAAWEKIALQQNWRVQSAAYTLQANRSLLDVAKAGHYPTLDLSAKYGNTELDGVGQVSPNQSTVDGTTTEGVLALQLNVPLYEGNGTEASIRQQRAQLEASDQNLKTVRRDVSVNARSFYRTVNSNIETVNSQEQSIVSRRSALDATRAGYEVGTRNIVEVLDAERNYYESLRDYANARYDYVVNTLNLKLVAGTLSPQDLVDLNRWLSSSAPGIGAIANDTKTVDPTKSR